MKIKQNKNKIDDTPPRYKIQVSLILWGELMKTTRKFIAALLAVTLVFVLFSCDDAPHVHTFSEDWSSDETYHWHKATCEHTEEVSGKAEHTFEEVTVASTCTKEGKKSKVCSVCGYEKDVTVIPKSHHLNDNLKCSDCGKFVVKDLGEFDKVCTYIATSAIENPSIVMTKGEYKISAPYTIDIANLTVEGEDGAIIVIAEDYKPSEEKSSSYGAVNLTGSKNTVKNLTFKSSTKTSAQIALFAGVADNLVVEGNIFKFEASSENTVAETYAPIGVLVVPAVNGTFNFKNNTFSGLDYGVYIVELENTSTSKATIVGNTFKDNIDSDISISDDSKITSYYTDAVCKEISEANNSCVIFNDGTYLAFESNVLEKTIANGGRVRLENDITLENAVSVSKNVTIDLNGKTLTLDGRLTIIDDNSLTIHSGKVKSLSVDYGMILTANAELTLNKVEYTSVGRAIRINEHADKSSLTITDSTVETTSDAFAIQTDATVKESEDVTVTIKNSTIKAGENKYDSNKDDSTAFMFNVKGTVTIESSKFYGKRQAAIFRGGTYTVKDSTFESTSTTTNYYSSGDYRDKNWGSGNEVPLAAIVIGNRSGSYPYDTTVTFEGTNILKVNETSVRTQIYVYQTNGHTVKVKDADSTWTVNSEKNSATYETKSNS